MKVTFRLAKTQRVTAESREDYQKIIALAIDASRPSGEQWFVTTHDLAGTTAIRLEFARDFEGSHGLTFLPESDDDQHTVLYRIVAQFLRRNWPGGLEPS